MPRFSATSSTEDARLGAVRARATAEPPEQPPCARQSTHQRDEARRLASSFSVLDREKLAIRTFDRELFPAEGELAEFRMADGSGASLTDVDVVLRPQTPERFADREAGRGRLSKACRRPTGTLSHFDEVPSVTEV
jgi:hypothetical protein